MVRRTQGSAVVGLLLIAAAAAFPQQHPDGDRLAARLSTLNQQLKEPNVSLAILSQRVAALSELMRLDPRRAISLAVPAEEAAVLSRYGPVERQGEWHGSLEVVVEDNFSRRTSRTHVWMDAGGEKLELFLPDGAESLRSGQIATVRGIRLAHAVAADATDTIPGGTPCNPIGEQRVAVLLVDFPGAPLRPEIATLDDIRNLYFSTAQPSLSTYWREVSYGKTWATGDVFGPIHMVQNYHYPEQWQDVATAAIRAADSMTDLRNYTHIDILWPGTEATAETSGWDGQATLGCITLVSPSKGSFTAGRTVLVIGNWSGSPRFAGNLFLPAHEQGHHFALNHADTMAFGAAPLGAPGASGTFLEYGSLYSAMGNVDTSQPDFPAAHYDAPHKLALGWLQKGSGVVDVETNGFFRLPPIEKSAAGPLALRVRRGSGSSPISRVSSSLSSLMACPSVSTAALPTSTTSALDRSTHSRQTT
jgi:M6 family metalloprotease-like protein